MIVAADLQLALYKRDGRHAEWVENEVAGVALRLRHPNGDEYVSTFTAEDARRAGLWGKLGPWSQYPVAMMRARAITAGLKAIGYAPTAGAYDSVSEELPTVVPGSPSSPIVTLTAARPVGEDGPASLPALCVIDDAIQHLELVCAEDAAVAARSTRSSWASLRERRRGRGGSFRGFGDESTREAPEATRQPIPQSGQKSRPR